MKLPEDNTGENLDGFRYDTFMIPKRMDKPDSTEIKNFCSAKDSGKRISQAKCVMEDRYATWTKIAYNSTGRKQGADSLTETAHFIRSPTWKAGHLWKQLWGGGPEAGVRQFASVNTPTAAGSQQPVV